MITKEKKKEPRNVNTFFFCLPQNDLSNIPECEITIFADIAQKARAISTCLRKTKIRKKKFKKKKVPALLKLLLLYLSNGCRSGICERI